MAVYLGAGVIGQMWGQLYQEPAQGAMAKLDNILPDEQRAEIAWAQRSLVATGMHRSDPGALSPLLKEIRRATRLRRQIKLTYQASAGPSLTERLVDPYALVHRNGWWYLVGYCHLRQSLRTFRLDRIKELELRDQEFQIEEGFDIHAYLEAEFKDQPVVRARLRFTPEAANLAVGLPGRESLKEYPDGSLELILAAPDLNWLASMTLSFANLVIVLEPPELKDMVREWALATAALYKDESLF